MDQQQVPLETPKESQSEKNKLLSQPQHLAIQLNNIPEQAVGDPLDADFVEGDHDNQQNALLENQLLAEIDNHMASKQYDVAYKKINLLLSNNEANPVETF